MANVEPIDLTEARYDLLARPRRNFGRRTFSGAATNRLTEDWATSILSRDQKLWTDLRKLRARCRELADNDSTASKFLSMVVNNVIGPKGVTLQAKVKLQRGDKLNKSLNDQIESAWAEWGERGNCTVDGKMSFLDVQRLVMRTVAMDGECLVRMLKFPNDYGFALQFIDMDQLDHTYFIEQTRIGTQIRQGVEMDLYRKPVAYWIWTQHPNEFSSGPRYRQRIPAEEIIHDFVPDSAAQTRGVPWMASVMWNMNMVRGYTEAEVVAARTASEKMGFLESETGQAYAGEQRNTDDTIAMEAQHGMIETLPPGMKFSSWDPQHPTSAFPFFLKAMKRDIAAGLGVSYNALAEDLEGVNFSSIRSGTLNERDGWKVRQQWFIQQFLCRVFEAWMESAVLTGYVNIGIAEVDDIAEQMEWHPRSWSWVDPFKDTQSNVLSVENGFATRTDILAEQGKDFEDTIELLKYEKETIDAAGLILGTDAKGVADTATDDQAGAQQTGN
jgi:lambda family phage portal protein